MCHKILSKAPASAKPSGHSILFAKLSIVFSLATLDNLRVTLKKIIKVALALEL